MLPIEAGLVVWMLSLVLVLVLLYFVVRFFVRLNRQVDRLDESRREVQGQD
jgi:uncharacterized protein HemY